MTSYLLRRLGQFVPVLLLATVVVWAMIYALPGNPAQVVGGTDATPEQLAEISSRMGLDQPIWQQFLTWLGNAVRGDLGTSFVSGHTVTSLILDRLPATVQLSVLAMIGIIVLAVPLGMVSALAQGTRLGRAVNVVLAAGLSIPTFWFGILFILVFSIYLGVLPAASDYAPLWSDPGAALRGGVLPALALALPAATVTARFIASSMTEVMERDFIRTARAKGAGEWRTVVRHGLRNALLPAVTMAGLQLGHLLGGAIVVEVVFTYPGLGRLLFAALSARDYALIQGVILFAVAIFLVLNVVIDLLYAYLDPRIRIG
ncbi:ABC transporter permease [Asanoa sp. NPDC050611]|uniref:ABC transporter permease n=1 Tax=Asanoa sp. NPDC050611 TaxID=3157098 RepID=UPI0033DC95AF